MPNIGWIYLQHVPQSYASKIAGVDLRSLAQGYAVAEKRKIVFHYLAVTFYLF